MTCRECETELVEVLGGAYCPRCNPPPRMEQPKKFYLILVDQNMEVVKFIGPATYDQCFNTIKLDANVLMTYAVNFDELIGEMEFETSIEDQEFGPLEAKWWIREVDSIGE